MVEGLVNWFMNTFSFIMEAQFGKEIMIFLISMTPILELRGGLIAAALLGMNPWTSLIICILGNVLPIPIILFFLTPIFKFMKKTKLLAPIVNKLEGKAYRQKDKVEKYKYWALCTFVAIPLPGTGAWTGGLIASVLEMDKKKSFISIFAGVLIASIIMMIFSYGLLANL
jgi:Predicted membrane protein